MTEKSIWQGKKYIFVQETWLVNTPTLILNSANLYLYRAHLRGVSEEREKSDHDSFNMGLSDNANLGHSYQSG